MTEQQKKSTIPVAKHHFLQSSQWREIKDRIGNKTYDFEGGWFQTTSIPGIGKKIGYAPRINLAEVSIDSLGDAAKKAGCVFVTVDPNQFANGVDPIKSEKFDLRFGAKSIQLQNTVMFDLSLSEDELLANMKRKYRYNVRYAKKKGVKVQFEKSEEAFEKFLGIYLDTKKRQQFYGRGEQYLRTVWDVLKGSNDSSSELDCHFAFAEVEGEAVVAWCIFLYKGVAYLPYGGSLTQHRNLNPTYLIVFETLKWLKSNGYEVFDFYGIEEDAGANEGFSSYKLGFGGEVVTFAESFNVITDKLLYPAVRLGMKARERVDWLKEIL